MICSGSATATACWRVTIPEFEASVSHTSPIGCLDYRDIRAVRVAPWIPGALQQRKLHLQSVCSKDHSLLFAGFSCSYGNWKNRPTACVQRLDGLELGDASIRQKRGVASVDLQGPRLAGLMLLELSSPLLSLGRPRQLVCITQLLAADDHLRDLVADSVPGTLSFASFFMASWHSGWTKPGQPQEPGHFRSENPEGCRPNDRHDSITRLYRKARAEPTQQLNSRELFLRAVVLLGSGGVFGSRVRREAPSFAEPVRANTGTRDVCNPVRASAEYALREWYSTSP